MSNLLQPKVIKVLEQEYNAFVVRATSTSKSGIMDVLACIPTTFNITNSAELNTTFGLFYGFEVKWKSDRPSELQKQKINSLQIAGGKGYFIRSIEQLRNIIDNNLPSEKYDIQSKFVL